MRRFAYGHLDYFPPMELIREPRIKEHKYKALAAISHLSGIGKLLRCVDLDACLVCDDAGRMREIEEASEGLQTLGDLIAIIADAAYVAVEEMAPDKSQ